MNTLAARPADRFPPELVYLLRTAQQVITEHANDCGICSCCGSMWPCQRGRLAEFTLGAL
jgi:hypothetical protein